jgi:hypothetical protein
MYTTGKIVALVGMSLVIVSVSIGAFAASKHTDAALEPWQKAARGAAWFAMQKN